MKIRNVSKNETVLSLDNGTEILFSYNTPVAAFVSGIGYVKTEKKWSATTSKHINSYLGSSIYTVKSMPQTYFDNLAN